MKILFVGDTHGFNDIGKITIERLKFLGMTKDDLIVHCGDIGISWAKPKDEVYEFWNNLLSPVVVCLGNHENYNWIEEQPIVERYNAKGYKIGENIFAPIIGEIVTYNNKTLWFYPGGYSIDYGFRTLDISIFKQELPFKEDSDQAIYQLFDKGPVDVVVSHDGPREFIVKNYGYNIKDASDKYLLKTMEERGLRVHPAFELDKLYANQQFFDRWYFGHHHKDVVDGKLTCLFNRMVLWDLRDNSTTFI